MRCAEAAAPFLAGLGAVALLMRLGTTGGITAAVLLLLLALFANVSADLLELNDLFFGENFHAAVVSLLVDGFDLLLLFFLGKLFVGDDAFDLPCRVLVNRAEFFDLFLGELEFFDEALAMLGVAVAVAVLLAVFTVAILVGAGGGLAKFFQFCVLFFAEQFAHCGIHFFEAFFELGFFLFLGEFFITVNGLGMFVPFFMDGLELGSLLIGEVERFFDVHALALLPPVLFTAILFTANFDLGHAALGFATAIAATLRRFLGLAGVALLAAIGAAKRLADGLAIYAAAWAALAAHGVWRTMLLLALTALVALALGE